MRFLFPFNPTHSEKKIIPFWFMRQAGRYLPEYRELRSQAKDFLHFCYSPDMAMEATLQPIRRFNMDAAIIFSDILVIPHALGMQVSFLAGEGPQLEALKNEQDFSRLSLDRLASHLAPIYEAIRRTRDALPAETALIGFAGAPWTLASYMLEGGGSRDFQKARQFALMNPALFRRLITLLEDAVAAHLLAQANAGANALQLFDSWAGVLSEDEFSQWVVAPAARIIHKVKQQIPSIPVIGFPRLAGAKYTDFTRLTGADALSLDATVPLAWAKAELQPHTVIQGNLDPLLLAHDKEAALAQAKKIIAHFSDKSFVFNLGHGILPHTPIAHVEALCDLLKNTDKHQ